jgi:hypothetical protein
MEDKIRRENGSDRSLSGNRLESAGNRVALHRRQTGTRTRARARAMAGGRGRVLGETQCGGGESGGPAPGGSDITGQPGRRRDRSLTHSGTFVVADGTGQRQIGSRRGDGRPGAHVGRDWRSRDAGPGHPGKIHTRRLPAGSRSRRSNLSPRPGCVQREGRVNAGRRAGSSGWSRSRAEVPEPVRHGAPVTDGASSAILPGWTPT